VRALAIRIRRVRHESLLVKAPPVAVKPVLAMLVSLEVADIDYAKGTHCRECPGFRSAERVGLASELDGLALVTARQRQAVCEHILIALGLFSGAMSFGRRTVYARLANVRPVVLSAASGHEVVGSVLAGTHGDAARSTRQAHT
jgi:hypothetical protein